jgi:hypothetical protein
MRGIVEGMWGFHSVFKQNAIHSDGNWAAREQFSKLDATLTRIQELGCRAAARAAASNDM